MDLLLTLVSTIGLTLAVGSSTYALIFFHQSILDGTIDATEKRFLHTVYFLLRLGMGILIVSELWKLFNLYDSGFPIFSDDTLWFHLTLLGIIIGNAWLMQKRRIPMWLGPALAGGSWYSYFFSTIFEPLALPYTSLLLYGICIVIFFIILLRLVREWMGKYTTPRDI